MNTVQVVSPVSLVLKFLRDLFSKKPSTKLILKFEVLSGTIEKPIDGDVGITITPKHQFECAFDSKGLTSTKRITKINSGVLADSKGLTVIDIGFKKEMISRD
jgi:hypothetical protein